MQLLIDRGFNINYGWNKKIFLGYLEWGRKSSWLLNLSRWHNRLWQTISRIWRKEKNIQGHRYFKFLEFIYCKQVTEDYEICPEGISRIILSRGAFLEEKNYLDWITTNQFLGRRFNAEHSHFLFSTLTCKSLLRSWLYRKLTFNQVQRPLFIKSFWPFS